MDAMMSIIYAWLDYPVIFEKSHDVNNTLDTEIVSKSDHKEEGCGGLSALHLRTFDQRDQLFFNSIQYQKCKKSRSSRNYTAQDPVAWPCLAHVFETQEAEEPEEQPVQI